MSSSASPTFPGSCGAESVVASDEVFGIGVDGTSSGVRGPILSGLGGGLVACYLARLGILALGVVLLRVVHDVQRIGGMYRWHTGGKEVFSLGRDD
jgi:hypothetical protein